MEISTNIPNFTLRFATEQDVPIVLRFIRDLAEYVKLSHEVVATEELLRETLFGDRQGAEVIFGYSDRKPVSFALFFQNYSTFLGRPGIYLEDLFVKPEARRKGIGRAMLAYLAQLARQRGCGRLEWGVLRWNEAAIAFYKSIDAVPIEEMTVYRLSGKALDRMAEEF
jgi:GNAT superfamily N-acetyltransferase